MENNNSAAAKEIAAIFEEKVRKDITEFLQYKGALDKHIPECPDVEERWGGMVRAYFPDGAREFQEYPVVSLGWMMFIGMAMAKYWDTDWEKYAAMSDEEIYKQLRDKKGYDNLDETVVNDVSGYEGEAAEKITDLVAECASRVLSMINHEPVEPGTEAALGCYIGALHQLYLAGMAMQLNALGYHMTPLSASQN